MLAPCGRSAYRSWTKGYAWSEIALTSSRPSSAHSFSVWMSFRTCSKSSPRLSTRPVASAQNMKASSASGLWPSRIFTRRRLAPATLQARHALDLVVGQEGRLAAQTRERVDPRRLFDRERARERVGQVSPEAHRTVVSDHAGQAGRDAPGALPAP